MKRLSMLATIVLGLMAVLLFWQANQDPKAALPSAAETSEPVGIVTSLTPGESAKRLEAAITGERSELQAPSPPTVNLIGRVEHGGLQLAEAEVWVYEDFDLSVGATPPVPTRVHCNDAGEFHVTAPFGASLVAAKEGLGATEFIRLSAPSQASTRQASDIDGLVLTLWDLQPIEGVVKNSDGSAASGAEVLARPNAANSGWRNTQSLNCSYHPLPRKEWQSDANGLFDGQLANCGSWGFGATSGQLRGRVQVERLGPERIEIILRDPTRGRTKLRLFGTVIDKQGRPIPFARVRHAGQETRTNQLGEWTFLVDSTDTPTTVRAADSGTTVTRRVIQSLTSDTGPLELALTKGVTIRGTLFDATGKPLPREVVKIEGEPKLARFTHPAKTELSFFGRGFVLTNENGEFELEGLEAREYRLVGEQRETYAIAIAMVTAPAQDVRLVLGKTEFDGVRFLGVVRDAISSDPVVGATVSADKRDELDRFSSSWNGVRTARTNVDGEFSLLGLDEGEYYVTAHCPGYASGKVMFMGAQFGRHEVTLELFPERTLQLLVLDPSGAPASEVRVTLRGHAGESWIVRRSSRTSTSAVITDKNGRAQLHGLPAALVTVEAKGHWAQEVTTLQVDLHSEEEHEATLELDLYPIPNSEMRTVRLHLRLESLEAQRALRHLDLEVFHADQRALWQFSLDLVGAQWRSSTIAARMQFDEERLTAFVPAPKGPARIQLTLPGEEPVWIEVPEILGSEGLTVYL